MNLERFYCSNSHGKNVCNSWFPCAFYIPCPWFAIVIFTLEVEVKQRVSVNLSCCCRKNISSLDVCCLLLSYVNENILRVLTQWELQESSSCCRPQYCSVIIATPFCHISCGFPVCSYLSPLSLSMLVSHFVDNTLGLSPCSAGACRERERTTRWPASEVQTIFVLYSRWMSHTHTHCDL